MPLHTLERYASGCCDGIQLSTGRVFLTRFFYSFFLFFRARTRGQAAKPLSMRVCGVFGASRTLPFLRFVLPFLRFVSLFCGAIHNLPFIFIGRNALNSRMFEVGD